MEHAYKEAVEKFPNPERLDKVEESMDNIESVVRERNRAYFEVNLLKIQSLLLIPKYLFGLGLILILLSIGYWQRRNPSKKGNFNWFTYVVFTVTVTLISDSIGDSDASAASSGGK